MRNVIRNLALVAFLCTLISTVAVADGGVTFTDIAEGDGAGVTYRRAQSPRSDLLPPMLLGGPYGIVDFFTVARPFQTPQKGRGAPGVVLFDYDRDGDLDIYVTNGPNASSALYSNQFVETGTVTFIDRAEEAGVEAFAQDSSGVCFGDLDNDGDEDLYVLGTAEPNLLFENLGNGTFADITAASGAAGNPRHSIACTMLDIDNDGLLDIYVGNSYSPWTNRAVVFLSGVYPDMEHNELFRNLGGNAFADVSAASGIETVSNMDIPGTTGAAFTWAVGSADYDLDGDVDIFSMDNQGGLARDRAEERGWIRIFDNDGAGNFTDRTIDAKTDLVGAWMGVDFGDFNCDGSMDFFGTEIGYISGRSSRWFYGAPDRTFSDPGTGALSQTPFGWGVSTFDYDNDADSDIIFHGGVDLTNVIVADNPGALLTNIGDCSGSFDYDADALLRSHVTRNVQGVAVGDLNSDGFEDIVTVSSFDITPRRFLPFVGIISPPTGSPFDAVARFELMFTGSINPGFLTFIGAVDGNGDVIPQPDGTLSVELSSADNGNGWVAFDLLGSAGILCQDDDDDDDDDGDDGDDDGDDDDDCDDEKDGIAGPLHNRDGIGATVLFTPNGKATSMRPVVGGASYASQDSLTANFGLGTATGGVVEVVWAGGVRNRLDDVVAGEQLVLPHIPCSFDGDFDKRSKFDKCVREALKPYKDAGFIDSHLRNRLRNSMRRAYDALN